MVANLGAYLSGNGPGASAVAASTAHGGVYDIPAIAVDVRGAFTNTVPVDAYRGAGKPEANYIIERAIEAAARVTRPRSGRPAAAEPDRVVPAQDRDGHGDRFRRLRRQSRCRRRARGHRRLRSAARGGEGARPAARHRRRLLPRNLARRAQRRRRGPLRARRHASRSRSAPSRTGRGTRRPSRRSRPRISACRSMPSVTSRPTRAR